MFETQFVKFLCCIDMSTPLYSQALYVQGTKLYQVMNAAPPLYSPRMSLFGLSVHVHRSIQWIRNESSLRPQTTKSLATSRMWLNSILHPQRLMSYVVLIHGSCMAWQTFTASQYTVKGDQTPNQLALVGPIARSLPCTQWC